MKNDPAPANPNEERSSKKTKLAANPASPEKLQRTILGWLETFGQSTDPDDDALRLKASVGDVKVFTDDNGNFYADYQVALNVNGYCSNQVGQYTVTRRRHRVTPQFALLQLLIAAIPQELFHLLPKELLVARNDLNDATITETPSNTEAVSFTGPDAGFKKN